MQEQNSKKRKGCGPDKEFTCEICAKVFTLPYFRWHSKEGRGSCCSKACMIVKMKAARVRSDIAKRVPTKCMHCGTEKLRAVSSARNANHFCSVVCQKANYATRTIERDCKWCGTAFRRSASQATGIGGDRRCQFCSKSCAGSYAIRHCQGRVSIQETRFFDLLEKHGVRVDRQCKVARYNVDGLIHEAKTIVEFDGVYWHGQPTTVKLDAKKDELFRQRGFRLIRVMDLDFKKNPHRTIQRVLAALHSQQETLFSI